MAFEKGDIVELKSGGPGMTVQTLGNFEMKGIEDGALCVWFDGKTKYQDVFDVATLKQVDEAYRGRS